MKIGMGMRRNAGWALVVVGAALFQTTWMDAIRFLGATPDLAILLVVFFALVDGEERAMYTGLLSGVFQDVAGDVVLGHHVLALVLVAYAAGRFTKRLVTDHPAVKVLLVFIASLLYGVLFTFILFVQQPQIPAFGMILTRVIPGAFYTALGTPIVFLLLDRLFARWLVPRGANV